MQSDEGVAAPVGSPVARVGGLGHILRGAFADLYQDSPGAISNDASPSGARAASSLGYESDETKEVRRSAGGAAGRPCGSAQSPAQCL
jgi:hypothetical protein